MSEHVPPLMGAIVVFGVIVLGFSAVSRALARKLVTAPLAFLVAGTVLGLLSDPMAGDALVNMKIVAEVTLVLILFHDAAQVRPREIEHDRSAILRLLLIGFPLTVVLGWLAAMGVFPTLSAMMALLLAAALAPTDAGLGAPTVLNPVVPARVRRLLNVESGLNDGLATPVVMFAIAAIAGSEGLRPRESIWQALVALTIGTAIGAACGWLGGRLLGRSRRARASTARTRALGVAMIPLLAYGGAILLSGNGFVAAFIAGTAFAGAARWVHEEESALALTESLADPLGYAVWLVFGIAAVPLVWHLVGPRELLFAVLALTVLRMGPVALCLLGTGLRPRTWAFVGWFGPRGLASIVFALLALESLEDDAQLRIVIATISVTVLLSVLAHGFSALPLARAYGAWARRERPVVELGESAEPRARSLMLADDPEIAGETSAAGGPSGVAG